MENFLLSAVQSKKHCCCYGFGGGQAGEGKQKWRVEERWRNGGKWTRKKFENKSGIVKLFFFFWNKTTWGPSRNIWSSGLNWICCFVCLFFRLIVKIFLFILVTNFLLSNFFFIVVNYFFSFFCLKVWKFFRVRRRGRKKAEGVDGGQKVKGKWGEREEEDNQREEIFTILSGCQICNLLLVTTANRCSPIWWCCINTYLFDSFKMFFKQANKQKMGKKEKQKGKKILFFYFEIN